MTRRRKDCDVWLIDILNDLDIIRNLYPNSSLADLYDELTKPPELRRAHQENDRTVMEVYGMDIKTTSESDAVAKLLELYEVLIRK